MRVVRLIVLTLLLLVVVIGVGGAALVVYVTRAPLPTHLGVIDVPGLRAEVEVLRDDWGVPHVYGSNLNDIFFAQGFVQAQDRWWQMEFSRAVGSGRIQQLIGRNDAAFGQDVFIRTVGWRRLAEQDYLHIAPDVQTLLQAFADGVNAYISSRAPHELALEYTLLGVTGVSFEIEAWTPVDTLAWGRALAWELSNSFNRDVQRATLTELYSAEMADEFFGEYDFDNRPTIFTPDDLPLAVETGDPAWLEPAESVNSLQMAGGVSNVYPLGGRGAEIGSNSWVVAGALTENGLPMLANDPHLDIAMPSVFYEIGLHCLPRTDACPLDVVGFALPAAPGVLIGRNQQIAWGLTTSYLDVQDVYRIVINPENPLQYEWNGGWRDLTVRDETLIFGDGAPPVTFQVRETHLGVIINDNQRDPDTGALLGFNNTDPLVLNWAGNQPTTIGEAALRINFAQDWQVFRDAVDLWNLPSQNLVYADRAGNIGYVLVGAVPLRPEGQSGRVPVLATDDSAAWLGWLPVEQTPFIFNPERGYIVAANNGIMPPGVPLLGATGDTPAATYQFGDNFAPGDRAQRINTLLTESDLHTTDTFRRMQADTVALTARGIIFPYLEALPVSSDMRAAQETLSYLLNWDHALTEGSSHAAIFAYLVRHLVIETFRDQVPDDIPVTIRQLKSIMQLLPDANNGWWDDARTPDVIETRDDILLRALQQAVSQIAAEQGNNPAEWRWGATHTANFINLPLGASGIELIESFVNRGPIPTGGGYATVNAQLWDLDTQQVEALPMLRIIVDFADDGINLVVNSTGQSAHATSDHYFDQNPLWAENNYRPLHFTRAEVEVATNNRLLLRPLTP